MKKIFISKKNMLHILDRSCDEIEKEIDSVSKNLYAGKTFTKEELLSMNCKLNDTCEGINEVADTVEYMSKTGNQTYKTFKLGFKIGTVLNIILFLLGSPFFAIFLELIEYRLLISADYAHQETNDYILAISSRGTKLVRRIENYQNTINIKIKKSLEVKDELDQDEEKNAKFDAALTLTDYLLRGYELEGGDPEILDLVKEILIEGGAEGETLGELIISMRAKLKSLEGGKTLSKE